MLKGLTSFIFVSVTDQFVSYYFVILKISENELNFCNVIIIQKVSRVIWFIRLTSVNEVTLSFKTGWIAYIRCQINENDKKMIKIVLLAHGNQLYVEMLKDYSIKSRFNQNASIHIQLGYTQSG